MEINAECLQDNLMKDTLLWRFSTRHYTVSAALFHFTILQQAVNQWSIANGTSRENCADNFSWKDEEEENATNYLFDYPRVFTQTSPYIMTPFSLSIDHHFLLILNRKISKKEEKN